MKARWIIYIFLVVLGAALYARMCLPPPIENTIQRLFAYRLQEQPRVTRHKAHTAMLAIHGVSYDEDATLTLSPADYQALVARLLHDPTFEKKPKFDGTGVFYSRFIIGKELLSWWTDEATREFSFSYVEY